MDYPREAAIKALLSCEQEGYSNLVLAAKLKDKKLNQQDRAFITALVYGTIERKIYLDAFLTHCCTRPLHKLDEAVLAILRSGLYQCFFMDRVPVRAAIHESVELTRVFKKTSAGGFVNAVLRKASQLRFSDLQFKNEIQRDSAFYCVSPEIMQLLQQAYPKQWKTILQASFLKPEQSIRVNTLKTDCNILKARLEAENISVQNSVLPHALVLHAKGDCTALTSFQQGLFQFQGEPSQCAALALQAAPNEKILDLCAAPGGKSALLGCMMENTGDLHVCDIQQGRLQQAKKNLERFGISCASYHCMDAAIYKPEFAQADGVLCDVPCSGLGILAKKPDIRSKNLKGLDSLYQMQANILETASRYVKHGGRLVYSTCTLNPKENELQIRAFLAKHPDYHLKQPKLPQKYLDDQDNMISFLPGEGQTDGFFLAYLERL